jgi:outer membrane lipoprotein-sorting protein
MVPIRPLVAVLLVAGNLTASRAEAAVDAFVEHQTATRTFEADLKQTFHWAFPPRHVESLGRISYQAPGFLAIVLTNPAPELVLVRGDDLYIQRAGKRLVRHKLEVRDGKPSQNVQFLLSFFQNGCTNFAGLFDIRVTTTNAARIVTLTPKHPVQLFPLRSVDNRIDWPSMNVRSMRIGLILGGSILYEFRNPRLNQPIDAAVFEAPKP